MKYIFISMVFSVILFSALALAQESKVFVLDLIIYKNDSNATLNDFSVADGIPTDFPEITEVFQGQEQYTIKIISVNNEVLFQKEFLISFTPAPFIPPSGTTPEVTNLTNVEKYLRLPYFEGAKKIEIYHDNKIIFTYEICNLNNVCEDGRGETTFNCPDDCELKITCGNNICDSNETQENCCKDCGCPNNMNCVNNTCVSEKCGDGKCDNGENYGNCPADCPSGLKDGYCDGIKDGLCDPDCQKNQDPDCSSSRIWIYVIIGIVIAVLLFFIFSRMRVRSEGREA